MNKRQKKKAYKKKYGFNPINTDAIILEIDWTDVVNDMVMLGERMKETIRYVANVIIPSMVEKIKEDLNKTSETIMELNNIIKNMTDEEWDILKKAMNDEQVELVEHMRKEWSKENE